MADRQVDDGLTITVPVHILIAAKRAVEREAAKLGQWIATQNGRPSERAMATAELEYLNRFLETVSKAREGK